MAAVTLGGTVLLVLFIGLWALRTGRPVEFIENTLTSQLSHHCGLHLSFRELQLEPLRAKIRLKELAVVDKADRQLLYVKQAFADLSVLSLLRGRVQITQLTLAQPKAQIEIRKGKIQGLPTCIDLDSTEPSSPPPLGIDVVEVSEGTFDVVSDTSPKSTWLEGVDEFRLNLKDVSAAIWPKKSGGSDVTFGAGIGRLVTVTEDSKAAAPKANAKKSPTPGDSHGLIPISRELSLNGLQVSGRIEGPLVRPRALNVHHVQASLGQLKLDVRGRVDFLGLVYEAKVQAEGDLSELSYMLPSLPKLGGNYNVSIDLHDSGAAPKVQTIVLLNHGQIGTRTLGQQVRIDAFIDRSGVNLHSIQAFFGDGWVKAKASVRFDEHLSFSADADTSGLSFARVMEALGEPGVWVDFAVTGPTRFKGTLRPVRLQGPFDFDVSRGQVWNHSWDKTPNKYPRSRAAEAQSTSSGQMLDVVPTHLSGRWKFTKSTIFFDNVSLKSDRSEGWVRASVRHAKPGSVLVQTEFEHLDFEDLGAVAGIQLRGKGPVKGQLKGPFTRLRAKGQLDLKDIFVGQTPLGDASGLLSWNGRKRLRIESINGALNSSRWNGKVQILFDELVPVDLEGQVTQGRLGDLMLPLGMKPEDTVNYDGDVQGKFVLEGPISMWRGPIDFQGQNLTIFGEKFPSGALKGLMVNGRLNFSKAQLNKSSGRIWTDGWLLPREQTLNLSIQSQDLLLEEVTQFSNLLPTVKGLVEIDSYLKGNMFKPEGHFNMYLEKIRASGRDFGDGRINVQLDGKVAQTEGLLDDIGVKLSSRVLMSPEMNYTAELELSEAPGPDVVGAIAGIEASGVTSLTATLEGELPRLLQSSGMVELQLLKVSAQDTQVDLLSPMSLPLKKGRLYLKQAEFGGRHLRFSANGHLSASATSVDVDGRFNLTLLSRWLSGADQSSGFFHFSGGVRQRARRGWELVGAGRIEDGLLEWRGIPSRLTGFSGNLTFTQSSLLLENLSGRWASGWVNLSGTVGFEDVLAPDFDLIMSLEKARPRMSLEWTDMAGLLYGQVEVAGVWPHLEVNGGVDIHRGRLIPNTDISQIIGSRTLAAAYDPSAEIMQLNIDLTLVDPVQVRNDDINVSVTGDLRLTGTNERLGLLGALTVPRGGRVIFVGREYRTEGGLIEMRDRYQLDTSYDLAVSVSACDARIQLSLVGDLEQLDTSYRSSPEMDRTDIVSCLIRGVRDQNLDEDLRSFASSALLKISGVDRQVKRVIPLDQIDVTTEFSSQALEYEPRVLVAKELSLINRPVRLEYSTSLNANNGQRAAFRINLTPLLSLQLGWTSSERIPIGVGDWGLDLKRSWEW